MENVKMLLNQAGLVILWLCHDQKVATGSVERTKDALPEAMVTWRELVWMMT